MKFDGEGAAVKKGSRTQISLTSDDALLLKGITTRGTTSTCFFNNKGGVGKTTLVANLAAELSLNFGAKILVVDADPQCNVTQYVLGEDRAIDIYSKDDPRSIHSVIKPLSLGKGYGDALPVESSPNFGFDILIGDPRLALQEDLLAGDWRDARGGGMRGIRTTFIFAELIARAKAKNYDFVFFDMGPSLGAINRAVLLAVDYFVVPTSIDIFSSWAMKNIGSTVDIWNRELKTGIQLSEDPAEIEHLKRVDGVRFLGYVTQQHKERSGYDKEISDDTGEEIKVKRRVKAYEEIGASLPKRVSQSLGKFFDKDKIDPHLGDIRHLGSLAPTSQSQGMPMISVSGSGSYTLLRKQAREIYRGIARRYLENLHRS